MTQGQNNFLIFDENYQNILDDVLYKEDNDRKNGNIQGIARSVLINKALRQSTIMTSVIGELIAENGNVATDTDPTQLKNSVAELLKSSNPENSNPLPKNTLNSSTTPDVIYFTPPPIVQVPWKNPVMYAVSQEGYSVTGDGGWSSGFVPYGAFSDYNNGNIFVRVNKNSGARSTSLTLPAGLKPYLTSVKQPYYHKGNTQSGGYNLWLYLDGVCVFYTAFNFAAGGIIPIPNIQFNVIVLKLVDSLQADWIDSSSFEFSGYELKENTDVGGTYDGKTITVRANTSTSTKGKTNENLEQKLELTPSSPSTNEVQSVIYNADGVVVAGVFQIFEQANLPVMNVGDLWFCTDPTNFCGYKKTSDGLIEFEFTKIGKAYFKKGVIDSVSSYPLNQNGYDVNIQTKDWQKSFSNREKYVLKAWDTVHFAASSGWLIISATTLSGSIPKVWRDSTIAGVNEPPINQSDPRSLFWGANTIVSTAIFIMVPITKGDYYKGTLGSLGTIYFAETMGGAN